jgi:hypothetical protein
MDFSQHTPAVDEGFSGVTDAGVGGATSPKMEDIGTDTLINDLRSIILQEVGEKFAQVIVRNYSGKVFTEIDVLSVLKSIIDTGSPLHVTTEDHATQPEPCLETSGNPGSMEPSEPPPDPPIAPGPPKPKRKNKVSGYSVFKKDPDIREKINAEYIPRKEQDKSLKFSTVASEMWNKADQDTYIAIANEINKVTAEANESVSSTP